jgi:hypothetical protein
MFHEYKNMIFPHESPGDKDSIYVSFGNFSCDPFLELDDQVHFVATS